MTSIELVQGLLVVAVFGVVIVWPTVWAMMKSSELGPARGWNRFDTLSAVILPVGLGVLALVAYG